MKNKDIRYSLNNLFFTLSYTLFVLSYFVLDIEQNTYDFSIISSLIRYTSFLIGIFGVFFLGKISFANIKIFVIVFTFAIFAFLFTHSTFFLGISILSLYIYKISDKKIIYLTLIIVSISTSAVILLQFLGVFENILTKRWLYSNEQGRNSFGFGHSNILPLNFMYITAYVLILNYKSIKYRYLCLFSFIAVFIYIKCDSRNALFITLLMCMFAVLYRLFCHFRITDRIFALISKYIVAICAFFSIACALMLTKFPILSKIDFLLSNRLSLSLSMIENFGLHFITKIDNNFYINNALVLDNGYLLIAIRYGLLYVVILAIISYFLGKRVGRNSILSIVMISIALANLIDNDLFDYSCLPFLLIGIKSTFIIKNSNKI